MLQRAGKRRERRGENVLVCIKLPHYLGLISRWGTELLSGKTLPLSYCPNLFQHSYIANFLSVPSLLVF